MMNPKLRGYTLVELMISMVIAIVLGVAALAMNKVLSSSARATASVTDVYSVFDSIQSLLTVPDACTRALKDVDGNRPQISLGALPLKPLASIRLDAWSGTTVATIAMGVKYGSFEITGLRFEADTTLSGALASTSVAAEDADVTKNQYHPRSSVTAGAGRNQYWHTTVRAARLIIAARSIASAGVIGAGTGTSIQRSYRFFVVTDDTNGNRMTECYKSWQADETIP